MTNEAGEVFVDTNKNDENEENEREFVRQAKLDEDLPLHLCMGAISVLALLLAYFVLRPYV